MLSKTKMVEAARIAIESTYRDKCSVTEFTAVKDEITKITEEKEVVVLADSPCKLSFERINNAQQTETGTTITQITKLFISPEIIIHPGSKITVTTSTGAVEDYECSGKPAVYDTHQEILMKLFKEWA